MRPSPPLTAFALISTATTSSVNRTFTAVLLSEPSLSLSPLTALLTKERSWRNNISYHLVRIAPNKKIGNHIHADQLETHEVIYGDGVCMNEGVELEYSIGTISIMKKGMPHEVIAGDEGLLLFAKFIPALC